MSSRRHPFERIGQGDCVISGSVYRTALSREEQHWVRQGFLRSTRTYHFRTLTPEEHHEGTTTTHCSDLSSVCIITGNGIQI
jgi:hypothetical protein